jgi:D-glycerate 3-kinase
MQFDGSLNIQLCSILTELAVGQSLTPEQQIQLEGLVRADWAACQAFDITSEQVSAVVSRRSHLFQRLYPLLDVVCREQLRWSTCPLVALWRLWLPLAIQLSQHQQSLGRPLIHGILGGQGTGKTSLAFILKVILQDLGQQVCCLSLDDLYKTYAERLQLQEQDSRLRWRGPPGTHDVELGLSVLQQFKQATATTVIPIPRFDKAAYQGMGDRSHVEFVTNIDIVLFEGWFVGVRPVDPIVFDTAPPPIVTDADRAFARDCNTRLQAYLPLWQQLDRLLVLDPIDYRLSQQWRWQAEQTMIVTGRLGMAQAEVDQFVEYFWRSLHPVLLIKPMLHDPTVVDMVVEIHPDHTPGAIYQPTAMAS